MKKTKKIFTKSVFEYNSSSCQYEVNESESEWHYISDNAPMAYCGGGDSGGGGGGTQSTTTVEKADPWAGQQPYLTTGFAQAQQQFLGQAPPAFYPGSMVVPYSNETNQAMEMQRQRALNGSPIQQSGTDQLTQTLRGDYLNNLGNVFYNPMQQQVQNQVSQQMGDGYSNQLNDLYNNSPVSSTVNSQLMDQINGKNLYGGQGFNQAVEAAQRQVTPQIDSAFEKSGRTGSGLAQEAKTRAFADVFAGQYGQERQNQLAAMGLGQAGTNAYAQQLGQAKQTQLQAGQLGQQSTQMLMDNLAKERENQMRGMLFAPQMASLDYQDISKLAEVGAQKEQLTQEQMAENVARWDYGQNAQQQQLAKYMNMIQGNYGGSSSGTSTSTGSGNSGGGGGSNFLGSVGGLLAPMLFGGGGFLGGI